MKSLSIIITLLVTASLHAADHLIIAQPGYPGTTEDARKFLEQFTAELRQRGAASLSGGEYHNSEADALAAIEKTKARIGIVSLGFYLKYRERLKLGALASSTPDEAFHVVVRKGELKSLGELAGKSITGTPLVEPEFIERIVVPGRPAWKAQPVKLFSRALRRVSKGRQDAVLLSGREYRGMQRLRAAEKLESIHQTAAYPTALVVSMGEALEAAEAKRLVAAFVELGGTAAGKELLLTMGIEAFKPAETERLSALEKKYQEGGKEAARTARE